MRSSDQAHGLMSIVELKNVTRATLPPSSPLRRVILSEPDYLKADEVPARVEVYSRLLHLEMDG